MSEYTRTINIRSYNLGAGDTTTFLLTFDSDNIPGIYKNIFPVAWKVTEFPKTGGYMFAATFKSQLGVTRAQFDHDDIVSPAATYIPINVGQRTTLTKKKNAYSFSEPTPAPVKDQLVAVNGTDGKENFGVGFFTRTVDYPPSTILCFQNVDARYSIQAKFQPILRGYVVSDSEIQENGVLKRRILTPVLFEEDLAKLDKVSYWRIIYDKGRGIYKIERDDQYMIWKAQAGYDD